MSRASLAAYGIAALARHPVVKATQIPNSIRAELEDIGEEVVVQKLALPSTHASGTVGIAKWESTEDGRRQAGVWLKEKRDNRDRLRRLNNGRDWATFFLVIIGVAIGLVSLLKP